MDLKNVIWKDFIIGQTFEVFSTSSSIDKTKLLNFKGDIPYITRTDQNNGCDSFIGTQDLRYKTDKANVITIGLDTQTVFYQKSKFYTGQNIQILEFEGLNEYNAKFIITLLKAQMSKFNWGGNGATLTRLRKTKILLPATLEGKPDYAFMESYIKEKEKKLVNKYKSYISLNIKELQKSRATEIVEKEWKEFEIGKLFTINTGKGKGLNHLTNIISGGVNYLGATNSNNGVLAYVEEVKNMIHKGNAICFIRNGEGSMGYSVYKAENFIATSDISVGYSEYLNKEIGLFITTIADKIRGKYNFGYKRSESRLKKEKILLPVNQIGKPDYHYMEQYMKALEYQKIMNYLDFKELKKMDLLSTL